MGYMGDLSTGGRGRRIGNLWEWRGEGKGYRGVKRCKNASYVSMKMVQRNPPTSVGKRGE
jgi:hypothetical protein